MVVHASTFPVSFDCTKDLRMDREVRRCGFLPSSLKKADKMGWHAVGEGLTVREGLPTDQALGLVRTISPEINLARKSCDFLGRPGNVSRGAKRQLVVEPLECRCNGLAGGREPPAECCHKLACLGLRATLQPRNSENLLEISEGQAMGACGFGKPLMMCLEKIWQATVMGQNTEAGPGVLEEVTLLGALAPLAYSVLRMPYNEVVAWSDASKE
eukprot:7746759-Karenia_brevis.AAC.1